MYSNGFSIYIDIISIGLPILYLKEICLNYDVFLSLKVVSILAKSADSDEMQLNAAFYLGLQCLSKYCLRVSGIQRVKA